MLPFSSAKLIKSARWLGLGALLAALPLSLTASPVEVDFNFMLEGLPGTVMVTYDPTVTPGTDATGQFVDASTGLDSFDVSWNGNNFTMTEALDYSTLPELLLPGNTLVAGGGYGILGAWVVSGTCTGPAPNYTCSDATILGVGNNVPSYLASGVSAFDVLSVSVNQSSFPTLVIGLDDTSFIRGTPEPALVPVIGLAFAGLFFARRRKATL